MLGCLGERLACTRHSASLFLFASQIKRRLYGTCLILYYLTDRESDGSFN
jgi:hypothetical protein